MEENVLHASSPSVCDLALFNVFISSVFNVVNTGDIIQVIFQRWRTNICFNNVVSILNRAYVKKTDDINTFNKARSHTDGAVVYLMV